MRLSEQPRAIRCGVKPLVEPGQIIDIRSFSEAMDPPDFGKHLSGSKERSILGINGIVDIPQYFSLGRRVQLARVFREGVEKKFINDGEGMKETPDVQSVFALRVTGQQLYNNLINSAGRHWFDDLYRGPLLTLTQFFLRNRKIYPADYPKDAYVGNGLITPEHRFIVHNDTERTASAVIFLNKIPDGMGGEFKIAFDPEIRGVEALAQSSGFTIKPRAFRTAFFYGQKPHGSFSIIEGAPPRFTIACTYYLPGYSTDLRPKEFDVNRQ